MKIVSVHIRSDSGDHYDYIFTDLNAFQIKEELWGWEGYYGCETWFASRGLTPDEEKELEKALSEVEQASWDWS